ncbi:MAG: chromate efflux transporter, partial [Anaerolineae bacterium]|nr:chromate efflux transporter [Anaerolineae bacterium]
MEPRPHRGRVREVALLFLKWGAISFGGPAAHVALMEQEAVHKRQWLDHKHFLDLLAATNLVPGPNAVEMASHIGSVRAGWAGLVAGGACFILPGFLASLALAWSYVRFGSLPQVAALFYGIYPAVLAIILAATYRLGRAALRDWRTLALAVALLDVHEVAVLVGAGMAGILLYAPPPWLQFLGLALVWGPSLLPLASWADPAGERVVRLGLFFLKVGALLFGSGMVLFAFIQRDVVSRYGWLTHRQLLDAIAAG